LDKLQILGEMMTQTLRVKRLTATATLPKRGSALAVGYDLCADLPNDITGFGKNVTQGRLLYPGVIMKVPTGIAAEIPVGYYGRVAPRSGLALKNGIDTLAGVIDPDYRGEIAVILINHSQHTLLIHHGDRIAQLVIEHVLTPIIEEVDELDDTERGSNGYGSTGISS
jgi:dUTP pyrophosphatase